MKMCPVCSRQYQPSRGAKGIVCSRRCAGKRGWSDPKRAAERSEKARIAASTPEARAAKGRARKWTPEERTKLAEQNRERWADPEVRAEWCDKVKAGWTPERRAHAAEAKKAAWVRDREKLTEGIRKAHRQAGYREKISESNRRRHAERRRRTPVYVEVAPELPLGGKEMLKANMASMARRSIKARKLSRRGIKAASAQELSEIAANTHGVPIKRYPPGAHAGWTPSWMK